MKIKQTLAVATIALASVSANAAWESGAAGTSQNPINGELILTVWNSDTNRSFSQDLGAYTQQFMTGAAAPSTFTVDQAGLAYIGTGNISYNVAGVSSLVDSGTDNFGFYFTSNTAPATNDSITFAAFQTQFSRVGGYENALLADGTRDGGTDADPVYFLDGQFNAGSGAVWGAQLNAITPTVTANAVSTAGADSELLNSWAIGLDGTDFVGSVAKQGLDWLFDSANGTLVYGNTAVVPVPAAAWLFGSALLGMIGVARRRKSVKA